MRKLLLATSALLGAAAGFAGTGNAGTLSPNSPNPAPGSITVTLNALVEAFFTAGSDTGSTRSGKTADYGIASYQRLYPSLDGRLANGITYGASVEIRHYSGFAIPGTAAVSGNASGTPASVTIPAQQSSTYYNQREFLYVGADRFGKLILGSPVQPTELFQTGNPANFNTGGWDGDLPGIFTTGIPYFIDDDNDRANKVVYVSPQFAGVDFGVSFEPNNFGNHFSSPGARVTSAPCATGTTAAGVVVTAAPQCGRRRNTVDASVRYTGAFGPVGLKLQGGASFGGAVQSNNNGIPGLTNVPGYRGFTLYAGGVSVTFAGFEIDGHIDAGVFGNDLGTIQRGSEGTVAYIGGASYTFGPVIVGASYYGFDSGEYKGQSTPGAPVGSLHGYGVAAGGTYTLAPGASVFLEYLYGHQRNNGYDIVAGAPGTINNNTRAQGFGIGTAFKW